MKCPRSAERLRRPSRPQAAPASPVCGAPPTLGRRPAPLSPESNAQPCPAWSLTSPLTAATPGPPEPPSKLRLLLSPPPLSPLGNASACWGCSDCGEDPLGDTEAGPEAGLPHSAGWAGQGQRAARMKDPASHRVVRPGDPSCGLGCPRPA